MAAKYRPTTHTEVGVEVPPGVTLEQMIPVVANSCKNVIMGGVERDSDSILDAIADHLEGFDPRCVISTYFLQMCNQLNMQSGRKTLLRLQFRRIHRGLEAQPEPDGTDPEVHGHLCLARDLYPGLVVTGVEVTSMDTIPNSIPPLLPRNGTTLSLQSAAGAHHADADGHFILWAMVLDQNGNNQWQYPEKAPAGFDVSRYGWVPLGYWNAFRFDDVRLPGEREGPTDMGYQFIVTSRLYSHLYSPLSTKTSVRLLHLQSGDDENEIRCKLMVHELNAAPSYEALSYVWGNPQPLQPIYLNDLCVSVGQNLFAALRQLRPCYQLRGRNPRCLVKDTGSPGEVDESDELHTLYKFLRRNNYWSRADSPTERVVWADAICINQQDVEEKSHQVKLMASIYSRASQVVIWLGADEGDAVNALPIIAASLGDYATSTKEDDPLPFKGFPHVAPPGYPNFGDEKWWSLARFYDKEWFERIWVIQEAALASSAVALLGKLQFDWDAIGDAALWLYHRKLTDAAYRYLQVSQRQLSESIPRMNKAAEIQYARKFRTTFDLIKASSTFKCTLPVDRIYGILGLVHDLQIEPDYSRPVAQVFRSMTRQLIEKRGDLIILGQINHKPGLSPSCASSWIPQWPCDPFISILNNSDVHTANRYSASAREPLKLQQHQDEKCLLLQGIPACKVLACGPTMERKSGAYSDILTMFKSIRNFIKFISIYLALNKSSSLRCYEGEDTDSVFTQILTAGEYSPSKTASPDIEFAVKALSLRSVIESGRIPGPGGEGREICPGVLYFNMEAEFSRDIIPKVVHVCNGRRLFMTNDGHFGIGPRAMEPEDEVAVLFGGITPFIVRSASQRRKEPQVYGSYRFVGESYVHGFMKGEVVAAWRNGLYNSVVFELE